MSVPFSIPIVQHSDLLPGFISNESVLRGYMTVSECNAHFAGEVGKANVVLVVLILFLIVVCVFCEYFLRKHRNAVKEVVRLKDELQRVQASVKPVEQEAGVREVRDDVQVRVEEKPHE